MNDKLGHQPLHPNHVEKKNSDRGARKRNCGSSSFFFLRPANFLVGLFSFFYSFHPLHTMSIPTPFFFFQRASLCPSVSQQNGQVERGRLNYDRSYFSFFPFVIAFSLILETIFFLFAQEHRNEYSILPSPPFSICYLSSYTPCVCVYVTFRVYIYIVSEIESVNIDGLNQWDGRRERNKVRLFFLNYFSFFRFLLLFLPRFRTK